MFYWRRISHTTLYALWSHYIYTYFLHIYVRKIKPVYYRRYVDDIFAPFRSHDHLEKFTNYLNSKHKILNLPMKKKVTINCLFWIFWYQDQTTVLKHLLTTNQLLVGYILTSIVSITTNIKSVWFLLCYLEHFQVSLTFLGFTQKSAI